MMIAFLRVSSTDLLKKSKSLETSYIDAERPHSFVLLHVMYTTLLVCSFLSTPTLGE